MEGDWRTWALTDVGTVPTNNEDSYICRPEIGLWMVADGAGGHDHGEVASRMLASALNAPSDLARADPIATIRGSVFPPHQQRRARANAEAAHAGRPVIIASAIVVFLASGPHYACLWAGDS